MSWYIPTIVEFVNEIYVVKIVVLQLFNIDIIKRTLGNIDKKTLRYKHIPKSLPSTQTIKCSNGF